MKFVLMHLLVILSLSSVNAWQDNPDRDDRRDLLSKEESQSRDNPNCPFHVDADKGCNPDSRSEPTTGTFGPPDRDN